jgi:polar amino acid transport system permease protein
MPDGLAVTFKITLCSICGALVLGTITGLCRISKIRPINLAASLYVEVVRGIPLLVQLFYIYYAIGRLIQVPPMVTAVMAISFCYGAYMGEVVRSGIEAIDRGQREAAMSLGFTPFQTMFHVILPQAIRTILPPIGNEFIAMLKDSSMVSVMAVPDIMRRAREFASTSFANFEAYTMVALSYLFITLLLSKMVSITETHMGKNERR